MSETVVGSREKSLHSRAKTTFSQLAFVLIGAHVLTDNFLFAGTFLVVVGIASVAVEAVADDIIFLCDGVPDVIEIRAVRPHEPGPIRRLGQTHPRTADCAHRNTWVTRGEPLMTCSDNFPILLSELSLTL